MGIKLAWPSQAAQNLDAIEVYRSTSPISVKSPGSPIVSLPGNATEYEDMTVKNNSLYYYRLAGKRGSDRSFGDNQLTGYFAETGPGRTYPMRGDWNAGFMDAVNPVDFINTADLVAKIGTFKPTSTSNVGFWYKVCHKGKVLYLPSGNIFTATWQELYDAGILYDTPDFGSSPAGAPGSVKQRKVIDINGLQYVVRTSKISPLPLTEYVTSIGQALDSEWRDVFTRLVASTTVGNAAGEKPRLGDATSIPSMIHMHHFNATSACATTTNPVQLSFSAKNSRMWCGIILELIMP